MVAVYLDVISKQTNCTMLKIVCQTNHLCMLMNSSCYHGGQKKQTQLTFSRSSRTVSGGYVLPSRDVLGVVLWLACVTNQSMIGLLLLPAQAVWPCNSLEESSQLKEKNKPLFFPTVFHKNCWKRDESKKFSRYIVPVPDLNVLFSSFYSAFILGFSEII